ncbi:IS1595 family transposase [Patescibacteria group bacterium]|nr:MAG: IS1595 family transposase [Patescibacteria group bacterium]
MIYSETQILQALRRMNWPRGLVCPDCFSKRVYTIRDKRKIKKYTCQNCLRRFSDISEVVFHKTRIPLVKWLSAFENYLSDSNYTARQLKNDFQISYAAARRMKKKFIEEEKELKNLLKFVL